MVEGKLRKFLGEITLLGQPFVKDDKQTVGEAAEAAPTPRCVRFVRFEVGAGIEKKQEDFAAEVMAQVRGSLSRRAGRVQTCQEPRASGVPYNGGPPSAR